MKKRVGIIVAALFLSLGVSAGPARADKSGVVLETVDQAENGAEVTVRVHVTHSANSFLHHTNWLRVKVNGEQIKSWEYSMNNLPEAAKFSKEIKLVINGATEVEAEANCNLHGGKGPALKTITLKPPAQ